MGIEQNPPAGCVLFQPLSTALPNREVTAEVTHPSSTLSWNAVTRLNKSLEGMVWFDLLILLLVF